MWQIALRIIKTTQSLFVFYLMILTSAEAVAQNASADLSGLGSIFTTPDFPGTGVAYSFGLVPLTLQTSGLPSRGQPFGIWLSYSSMASVTVEGRCGTPGGFFTCPPINSSDTTKFSQKVSAGVYSPLLPIPIVAGTETKSTPVTLTDFVSNQAKLVSNYSWLMPIPAADVSAFSNPVYLGVNTDEFVSGAWPLTVYTAKFLGTASIKASLLYDLLEEPKLNPLQKATLVAQSAFLVVLSTVGAVECPSCSPYIFEVADGVLSNLLPLIADPADPNYMVLADPSDPPVLTSPDIPGLTEQQTAAWTDFVRNLALWSSLSGAMLDSIDRAQGAYEAGDRLWAAAQLANFDNYYQQGLIYASAVTTDAEALGLVSGSTPTIPEPSTWAMTLVGFGGVGWLARQRRRKLAPA